MRSPTLFRHNVSVYAARQAFDARCSAGHVPRALCPGASVSQRSVVCLLQGRSAVHTQRAVPRGQMGSGAGGAAADSRVVQYPVIITLWWSS